MERTHEIGIMKAIGARNTDVMMIYIMEGVLISLIGGIAGIILGLIGANSFSSITSSGFVGSSIPMTPVITPTTIIFSLIMAIFVGVMSSLYPARKAAKMSPIEAVRYE
jgi:putative ABC transport system permease protein